MIWTEIRGDFREEKETKFIYIKINRSKKDSGVKDGSQVIGLMDRE